MTPTPTLNFSEYFKTLDKTSVHKLSHEFYVNKEYQRLTDQWKKPLQRKQIRKQRKLENPVLPVEEDPTSSLYVHNAEQGMQLPPNPNDIFAVMRIKGL